VFLLFSAILGVFRFKDSKKWQGGLKNCFHQNLFWSNYEADCPKNGSRKKNAFYKSVLDLNLASKCASTFSSLSKMVQKLLHLKVIHSGASEHTMTKGCNVIALQCTELRLLNLFQTLHITDESHLYGVQAGSMF
jgi:hypothetical protein